MGDIKVGDAVKLKNGDPTVMVVEWVSDEYGTLTAGCSWLDKKQEKKSARWAVAVLTKA